MGLHFSTHDDLSQWGRIMMHGTCLMKQELMNISTGVGYWDSIFFSAKGNHDSFFKRASTTLHMEGEITKLGNFKGRHSINGSIDEKYAFGLTFVSALF